MSIFTKGNYLTSGLAYYLRETVAPAPSRASFALSASSLDAPSRTALGAPSARSLASFSPRLVRARTSLMTWIFLSPAASRTTSNSLCSSAAGAASPPAAPPAAATATGAAAVTSNTSSNSLMNSESSMRVSSLKASMSSSVVSFAIVGVLPVKVLLEWSNGGLHRPPHGPRWAYWDFACAIRLLRRLLRSLLPRRRAASREARRCTYSLRGRSSEEESGLRKRCLGGTSKLGEQYFAGFQIRKFIE